jgi:formylglycine-generating enzyme required for sulfatase activity
MQGSQTTRIDLVFLLLGSLVCSPGVMGEACGPEAGGKLSHPKLVYVKGGTFEMGDVLGDGDQAMLAETPVHEVELGSFLLSPCEVTVAEFRQFVEASEYRTLAEMDEKGKATKEMTAQGKVKCPNWKVHWFDQTDQHPVIWVAWEDAIVYCNWLSKKHGLPAAYDESTGQLLDKAGEATTDVRQVQGFRLPTEAEWEYAARERGETVRFGNGKNVARADEMNFDARKAEKVYGVQGEYRAATTPVGSFAPNALGLYDMSGNAWEWCTDSGVDYPSEKVTNPYALHEGGHMARGGTWDSGADGCRVTTRINWWLGSMCAATGFRVARTAD